MAEQRWVQCPRCGWTGKPLPPEERLDDIGCPICTEELAGQEEV